MKFEIGQYVTGIEGVAPKVICDMISGEVIDILPNGNCKVKVIKHKVREPGDVYSIPQDILMETRKGRYKIGDVVKIRSWDSLVEEFGVDGCGDIPVGGYFISYMRPSCGNSFKINNITDHRGFLHDNRMDFGYTISMIEGESYDNGMGTAIYGYTFTDEMFEN